MNGPIHPSGIVTFLFTDIEGSTRRWESDPETMRAALAAHDEVLRSAIETHGGYLFKHTGDGTCAAFASPKAAVDTAVGAERALELPVRMGIATGEAELRAGDYFGAVLNRAARVMAAGHGGQVLLDGQTAGLLRGVDLIDLGARRLRDLSTPVRVYQVRADGLASEFPPLRALDTPLGNLRPAASSLIGRKGELDDVTAAVHEHRVVTLTGVGGVGKTRLALGAAAELADEFADGVWVCELASVTDAAAVPDAVASVLGITQQPGKTVTESVAAALEGRVRLLVFDNCEHVLDAVADLIEAILAQSATVRILATSREGLGTADEQVWPVPSLDIEAGIDSAAVQLFADRAHSVAPQFSLTALDEAEAAIDICRRLDGLPLAIELAASRMASMSATEVRDRLDDRFRLLVGSRRSLSRHQTLRHAVAWSYDLLGDDEKSLLDRCSVFTGGFDLQSGCAVMEVEDEYVALDRLDALVRKSLLVTDRSSGHTRYSMLETIRQFAEDQLVASGQAPEVRNRHARYFAGREAEIMAIWDSPRQREAYDWLITELANLRTAFRWAADQGDVDTAAVIATYVPFVGFFIDNFEPISWTEELLRSEGIEDHQRVAFLYAMAAQCYATGRVESAVRYADAGQEVIVSGRAEALYGLEGALGIAHFVSGQPELCIDWCRACLARGRDTHGTIRTTLVTSLGLISSAEAIDAADGLIEIAEATQNPGALSQALLACGVAERDPLRGLEALRRGLVIAQQSGNRYIESLLAAGVARLEAQYGDPFVALDHFTLVLRNYHEAGSISLILSPLASLSDLLHKLGRHEPAATLAGFATNPFTTATVPEMSSTLDQLHGVLGDEVYDLHARRGNAMTTTEIVTYAFDQIDQARAELIAVAE